MPKARLIEAMVNRISIIARIRARLGFDLGSGEDPVCPECKEIWDGMREGDKE